MTHVPRSFRGFNNLQLPLVTMSEAIKFWKGDNEGWFHKSPSHPEGYFHTYDHLRATGDAHPRKIHIWLPADYESSTESFPVIYFHDGNTTFWAGGISPHSWEVHDTLNQLWREGKAKKVLVVALHSLNRNQEYTHDYWCPGMDSGGVMGYTNYLAHQLKPWIDRNYRTKSDRENTMVLGSSHGGLAAFITAALHPGLFGIAGCFSPSFWVGLGFGNLESSLLLEMTRAGLAGHPKFWFSYGLCRSGGLHNLVVEALATSRTKEMVTVLQTQFGYDDDMVSVYEDLEGKHDEFTWQRHFRLFAEKYLSR